MKCLLTNLLIEVKNYPTQIPKWLKKDRGKQSRTQKIFRVEGAKY